MRLLRFAVLCVMVTFFMSFSACSSNNAEELFKTAQFEELQKNQKHAAELYQEIINSYPDNEFAKKAKERLSEIGK